MIKMVNFCMYGIKRKDFSMPESLRNVINEDCINIINRLNMAVGVFTTKKNYTKMRNINKEIVDKKFNIFNGLYRQDAQSSFYRSMYKMLYVNSQGRFIIEKGELFEQDPANPDFIISRENSNHSIRYSDYGFLFYQLHPEKVHLGDEVLSKFYIDFFKEPIDYFGINIESISGTRDVFRATTITRLTAGNFFHNFTPIRYILNDFLILYYFQKKQIKNRINSLFNFDSEESINESNKRNTKQIKKIINYSFKTENEILVFFDNNTSKIYQIKDNLFKTLMSAAKENL